MKKQTSLISVIIPCYNQGEYLHRAINSVLVQTYQNFEIIIIDDGSTEHSTIECFKLINDDKIRIFHTRNNGLAAARNYGLSKANGRYIQFLDADDEIENEKFSKQLNHFAQKKDLDVSYTLFYYNYDETNKREYASYESLSMENATEELLCRWFVSLSIPIHCFMFKKKVFQNSKFNCSLYGCEDWLMWCELAMKKHSFQALEYTGAIYHVHSHNMTKQYEKMFYAHALATAILRGKILDKNLLKKFDLESAFRLKFIYDKLFNINSHAIRQELDLIKKSRFYKLSLIYKQIKRRLQFKN